MGPMIRSGSLRSMTADVFSPQLAEQVDEEKEYELQKRELVRLLRSAQSEERRDALSQSLQELDAQFQEATTHPRLGLGGLRSSLTDTDESEDESMGMSPGSSRASTPRESSPYDASRRFLADPASPLALWSGKMRSDREDSAPSTPSPFTNTPVPDINLRRLSAGDAPLSEKSSGKGSGLPSSARPMSARRRSTKELRTIPENRPFIRPLSSKAKTGSRRSLQSFPQSGAVLSQRLSKHTLSASGRPLPSPERLAELLGKEIDLVDEGILIDVWASSFDPLHPPAHALSSGWPPSEGAGGGTAGPRSSPPPLHDWRAIPSSSSSQNSSHGPTSTFWITTGNFPHTLTVSFGCKVHLIRVSFEASGVPVLCLGGIYADTPLARQELPVPEDLDTSTHGDFPPCLLAFQAEVTGRQSDDQGTTELSIVIRTADSLFCTIQGLRVVGRIAASG